MRIVGGMSLLSKVKGSVAAGVGAAVATAAGIGTALVKTDSPTYTSLSKPTWQPPETVFPFAWTALYTDIFATQSYAISQLHEENRTDEEKAQATALLVNLALNAAWCGVFFRSRKTWLAAAWAAVLAGSSWDLVYRTSKVSPQAALALSPYGAWTTFATALSTAIAWMNRK